MGAYLKAIALQIIRNIPECNIPNVKNQRGWRGEFFAGGRLCLRMVNRKKVLNHFEVKKTMNKAMVKN